MTPSNSNCCLTCLLDAPVKLCVLSAHTYSLQRTLSLPLFSQPSSQPNMPDLSRLCQCSSRQSSSSLHI
jgi:hypothetical protein